MNEKIIIHWLDRREIKMIWKATDAKRDNNKEKQDREGKWKEANEIETKKDDNR